MKVAVISPHLDDAVLSLGRWVARQASRGDRVTIVTLYSGNPNSSAPASRWDRASGFKTEGEAATRKRREDSEACAALGAVPRQLSLRPDGDPRTSLEVLEDALHGEDAALVPGWPLQHPDHKAAHLLSGRGLPVGRVGFYCEQPYAFEVLRGREPGPPWEVVLEVDHWVGRKERAVDQYRSQRSVMGRRATVAGWEALFWCAPGP